MKKLARSVPGENARTIASRSLDIPRVQQATTTMIGLLIWQELNSLCSDNFRSVFRYTLKKALEAFTLSPAMEE